jgi:hypothetical protein
MLLQSLRVLCEAPGGPGSIWKYLEALVRATGESGRFACGFRTDFHFADELKVLCCADGDSYSIPDRPGRPVHRPVACSSGQTMLFDFRNCACRH